MRIDGCDLAFALHFGCSLVPSMSGTFGRRRRRRAVLLVAHLAESDGQIDRERGLADSALAEPTAMMALTPAKLWSGLLLAWRMGMSAHLEIIREGTLRSELEVRL